MTDVLFYLINKIIKLKELENFHYNTKINNIINDFIFKIILTS